MSGIVIQVNHAACAEDEPKEREKCTCQKKVRKPDALSQKPSGGNEISSIRNKNRKKVEEARKYGTWLMSHWSEDVSLLS